MSQVSAGDPQHLLPCGVRTYAEPGGGGLCSPRLCDLGRPCTLSGPKSGRTGRAGGGHPESRQHTLAWVLGRLLGGGAWPRPAGCLITHGISYRAPAPGAQAPPTIALCDLDGVLTLSAPQFSYLQNGDNITAWLALVTVTAAIIVMSFV